MSGYQCAIGIYGLVQNFTILGNYFYGGSGYAIYATALLESYIGENSMSGQVSDGGGISLTDSEEVRIERNLMETGGPAIDVELSENITISDNSIGTYIGSYHPADFGILVVDSGSVNITYNKIASRTVGVMILSTSPSSSDAWIHHNGFMNNDIQALDTSAMQNHWDDGAGSGNYWADYHGSDNNHDGIGDSPYMIDSDTWDSYPLMVMPV